MTAEEKIAVSNLAFFESQFLRRTSTVAMLPLQAWIGVIEGALWLRLGVNVGYFPREYALRVLLSLSDDLVAAWSRLKQAQVVSTEDTLSGLFADDMTLDAESFLLSLDTSLRNAVGLSPIFQGCLLLAIELINDRNAQAFLQRIYTSTDSDWALLAERGASVEAHPGKFAFFPSETMYKGLASSIGYLEGTLECLSGRPERQVQTMALTREVCSITRRRYHLGRHETRARYFRLLGQLAKQLGTDDPVALDSRWRLFYRLVWLVTAYAGSIPSEELHKLWRLYSGASAGTSQAVETSEAGEASAPDLPQIVLPQDWPTQEYWLQRPKEREYDEEG